MEKKTLRILWAVIAGLTILSMLTYRVAYFLL